MNGRNANAIVLCLDRLLALRDEYQTYAKAEIEKRMPPGVPPCEGDCNRWLFSKDTWELFPSDMKMRMNPWFAPVVRSLDGVVMCRPCYSKHTNKARLSHPETLVLSPGDVEYLKRMARGG